MQITQEHQYPIFQSGTIKFLISFIIGVLFGILSTSTHKFRPSQIVVFRNQTSDCAVNISNTIQTQVNITNTTVTPPVTKETVRSTEEIVALTPKNIAAFYEEYYKFYELNTLW